ncbi:MAG TPA: carboxypeptidase regulatory-like domain-containing protein [Gemmatimonadales bacterium]|nr:carboxypeptidase regulatory-like domain-containing protein [Gemmatimonadales bacterium]
MKLPGKICLLFALAVVAGTTALRAQGVTTSAMTGVVSDSSGVPLVGAHVVAVHGPSGTSYVGSSGSDGRFTLPGMRVGGPYSVRVAYVGYRQQVQDRIYLQLGVTADLHFMLTPVSVEIEPITVTGQADPIFSSARTGSATAVPTAAIQQLPTVTRRVEDLLRLTPQYENGTNGYSFAGQNNLLNNMTIDGSYFNNSFGLAGEPGDRTGVPAVSLDALEQVEVNVAPYDVRQGNFVGAGVNMVTKSGTNQFTGSLYYGWRSNTNVGTQAGANTFNPGTFKFHNIGVNLGGPIIPNRLFFFASYENDAQTTPATTFTANTGSQTVGGTVTRVLASDLDSISSFMQHSFNFNPGAYQGYSFQIPSTRFLTRLDLNVNEHNKISVRYNLLNSQSPILMSNSASLGVGGVRSNVNSLNFQGSNYAILENIRSIVGEWNSTIGAKMSNNFIIGYTQSDESRSNTSPPWFPLIEILNGGTAYTALGFEPFTPDNTLKYHSFQLQDNYNFYLRNHTVTFGVSYEKYHSLNIFFPGAQSVYVYNSLADFYTDLNGYLANPNRTTSPVTLNTFQYRYANIPGQSVPVQPLDVQYAGVYAQDQWRPTTNMTVTAGLRVDAPWFGNTAYDNAQADTMHFRLGFGCVTTSTTCPTTQYNTGKLPSVKPELSPRLGLNYDVGGRHTTQLRGGTGLFAGRPAYVWISNQIGNTGVLTGFIQQKGTVNYPFNPNPYHYAPASVTGGPAASYELALTDPNFKFPQVWRTNFGVDQRLPWFGLTASAEYLYTRDVNGIAYQNVNLPAADTTFQGLDHRPRWLNTATSPHANQLYTAVSADATVLTNEGIGYSSVLTFTLERPVTTGLYAKVGYSYGVSRNTVDPGSIAFGSWSANAQSADPNNPGAGYSGNMQKNRFFAALTYSQNFIGKLVGAPWVGNTAVSVYFDGHTNGNTSYVFAGDMNGDGVRGNDLIWIPTRDTSQMNFVPLTVGSGASAVTYTRQQQQAAWEAFIDQDAYLSSHRGQYAQRNAVFLPMVWRADVSISQDIGRALAGQVSRFQIRIDILNFTNWLNHNWGLGQIPTLPSAGTGTVAPLVFVGTDANGAPTYRLENIGTSLISHSFQQSVTTNDVWRMNLGVRYMLN